MPHTIQTATPSDTSEKPVMTISRRRAWVIAFVIACTFWAAVAAVVGIAIHNAHQAEQAEKAAASSRAD